MSKDLSISILMDFYSELLTQKQRDALDLYYDKDFSLGEIAQELEISRQGVRDFIKRGEKQLTELEEKLGMAKKYTLITKNIEKMKELLVGMNAASLSTDREKLMKHLSEVSKVL